MGYDISPEKGQKNFVVMCKWNESICQDCYRSLIEYCESKNMSEIPDLLMCSFYVPAEWFHANEKLGCPHGRKKLLKSAYVKD